MRSGRGDQGLMGATIGQGSLAARGPYGLNDVQGWGLGGGGGGEGRRG